VSKSEIHATMLKRDQNKSEAGLLRLVVVDLLISRRRFPSGCKRARRNQQLASSCRTHKWLDTQLNKFGSRALSISRGKGRPASEVVEIGR